MNKRAIVARLNSLLKPLGFTRHGSVWNRRAGDFVEVIDVQTSKVGDSITLNAGVADPKVYRELWGDDLAVVQEPKCTVRARIGKLIDGKDVWWPLYGNETPDQVAEATTDYLLPFVHRMCSRGEMVQWLRNSNVIAKQPYPPPIISLAILQHYLGQTLEARALLLDLQKKTSDSWRAKVAEIADRLGIE